MSEDAELYLQTVWIPPGKLIWVESSKGHYPPNAIKAGKSSSGSDIFVIRANIGGDILPGLLQDGHSSASVPVNKDMQSGVSEYEVLCGDGNNVAWVSSCGGMKINNAIIGGSTADGEMLFIGRTHHEGAIVPGKVQPSLGNLSITYFGKYKVFRGYEVLVGAV